MLPFGYWLPCDGNPICVCLWRKAGSIKLILNGFMEVAYVYPKAVGGNPQDRRDFSAATRIGTMQK